MNRRISSLGDSSSHKLIVLIQKLKTLPRLVYLAVFSFFMTYALIHLFARLLIKDKASALLDIYEAVNRCVTSPRFLGCIGLLVLIIYFWRHKATLANKASCLQGLASILTEILSDNHTAHQSSTKLVRREITLSLSGKYLSYYFVFSIIVVLALRGCWAICTIAHQSANMNALRPQALTVQIISDERDHEHGARYTAEVLSPVQYRNAHIVLLTTTHHEELFLGKLYQINGSFTPSSTAQRQSTMLQGICGLYRASGISQLSALPDNRDFSLSLMQFLRWHLSDFRIVAQDLLGARVDQAHGLMAAISLGDKRGLFIDSLQEDLQITGLAHVVAVSGMHLSIVITLASGLSERAGLSHRFRFLIVIVLSLLFLVITGVQHSTLRAYLMIISVILARNCGRNTLGLSALSLALITILIAHPLAAASISLQLSALSVAGLILFSRPLYDWLLPHLPARISILPGVNALLELASVSISAQIATTWLVALITGRISLIATFANCIIVGVIPVLLIGALTLCALGLVRECIAHWIPPGIETHLSISHGLTMEPIISWMQSIIWQILTLIIDLFHGALAVLAQCICALVHALASAPYAAIPLTTSNICICIIVMLLISILLCRKYRHLTLLLGFMFVVTCVFSTMHEIYQSHATSVTMLNVGQGDALVLQARGSVALIDTGPDCSVVSELRAMDITAVDLLILTHLDRDHVGGLDALAYYLKAQAVALPQGALNHLSHDQLACLEKMGVSQVYEVVGMDRLYFDGFTIDILGPLKTVSGHENEESVVCQVVLKPSIWPSVMGGELTVLATGDAPADTVLDELIHHPPLPDTDVLKVSHHGAKNGTSQPLLKEVSPDIALISCALTNPYGHPHETCINALTEENVLYFVSGWDGRTTIYNINDLLQVE